MLLKRLRSALNAGRLVYLHQYCASKYSLHERKGMRNIACSCSRKFVRCFQKSLACLRHSIVSEISISGQYPDGCRIADVFVCLCTDSYRLQFASRRRSTNATNISTRLIPKRIASRSLMATFPA